MQYLKQLTMVEIWLHGILQHAEKAPVLCRGQQKTPEGKIVCKPTQRLDFELEMVSSLLIERTWNNICSFVISHNCDGDLKHELVVRQP